MSSRAALAVGGVSLGGILLYLGLKKTGALDSLIASSPTLQAFNDKLGDVGSVLGVQGISKSPDWLGTGATVQSNVLFSDIYSNDRAVKIADAIAFAEGYYSPGSRPARNNNPGDLTKDITGAGIGNDGSYVKYPSPEAGWTALIKQVKLMLNCQSEYYCGTNTIYQVSRLYTATQQDAWAKNVAARLNVSVNTRLQEV